MTVALWTLPSQTRPVPITLVTVKVSDTLGRRAADLQPEAVPVDVVMYVPEPATLPHFPTTFAAGTGLPVASLMITDATKIFPFLLVEKTLVVGTEAVTVLPAGG